MFALYRMYRENMISGATHENVCEKILQHVDESNRENFKRLLNRFKEQLQGEANLVEKER